MKKIFIRTILGIFVLFIILAIYLLFVIKSISGVSEGEPIAKYEKRKSALMVIDIQEGTTGELAITEGYIKQRKLFLTAVNKVIDMSNTSDLIIVYIKNETTNWLINFLDQNLAAKGHPGTEFDKDLKVVSKNQFTKHEMDAFSNLKLNEFLIKKQVNHLYIIGLDAAYCVDRTMKAALNRGYELTIIEDAVISETAELKAEKLQEFKQLGIIVIKVNDLINAIVSSEYMLN